MNTKIGLWIQLLAIAILQVSTLNAKPLNIVFITVDDMNFDSVGAYGCPIENITPNIDRLASEGMRFEHAHVTIAICQPTRAVWMTGRYPHRNGALGFDPIDSDVPTLVEALKAAGYYTSLLGKTTHVVPTRKNAWDHRVPVKKLGSGRSPKRYFKECRQSITAAKKQNKPFFIMANSHDPHRPFAGSQQESRRKLRQFFPDPPRTFKPRDVPVPGFLPNLPNVRRELSEYFASVHRADKTVGSVLNAIEESGQTDNTMVIFMSDHGMPLPFAKTNCWLHSTKTPWIVRWPGVVAAGKVDRQHMISGIDLAPTILAAVQQSNLSGADGMSIVSILQGEKQTHRNFVFTHINRTAGKNAYPMRSVVTKKFGYIYNAWSDGKTIFKNESQNGLTMNAMKAAAITNPFIQNRVDHFLKRCPEELYDYQADPFALKNLIDDPNHAETVKKLREALFKHMTETGDPQLASFRHVLK